MNIGLYDAVYGRFETFLKEHCTFDIMLLNQPAGEIFPNVVFEEINNTSISISDPHSLISYEINIYAKDKVIDGELVSSMDVARIISRYSAMFMEQICGFRRIANKPTPNIDSNIYRITMQYTAKASDTRCHFF